jgi:DNA-binding NarL/FixJ family response regulator
MHTHSIAGQPVVSAAPAIRLLLVDDHGIVREGLRALLDDCEEFAIVGEATNGDEACEAVRRLKPDIVLMDLKMPGLPASDAIRVIRASSATVKVIALTSYAEDGQVREIISAGAQGYILKDVTKADFLTALRTVAGGQTWLHPQAQRALVEQLRNRQADPLALLTQRERSVLDLIARGMSNRQIGDELHLTEGTVKGYVSTILAKLKLEDRTQAALFAVQRGLTKKSGCRAKECRAEARPTRTGARPTSQRSDFEALAAQRQRAHPLSRCGEDRVTDRRRDRRQRRLADAGR